MTNIKKNSGMSILGILILGFIIILVLSYFFNVTVQDVVESPENQENIEYVEEKTKSFWDEHLEEPFSYLWNDVWIDIFWKSFILNMERIRDGEPTELDAAAKNLQIDNN